MGYQWKPGELAKCISTAGGPEENPIPVGTILPVKKYYPQTIVTHEALEFDGWRNPCMSYAGFHGYLASKFRPIGLEDLEIIREKHKLPESMK